MFIIILKLSIYSLESTLSHAGGLQSEIDKLRKELKEKDHILESFKEEKQSLSEQLEKVCADAKKKSVLSLEMADMEVCILHIEILKKIFQQQLFFYMFIY